MNYSIAFSANVNARNAIASVTARNVLLVTAIATLEVANVIKAMYLIAEWLLCEVASYGDVMPATEWSEYITVRCDAELQADTLKPQAICNALTFVVALAETLTTWVSDSPKVDLDTMTFKALREYATTLGIKGKSRNDITRKLEALTLTA